MWIGIEQNKISQGCPWWGKVTLTLEVKVKVTKRKGVYDLDLVIIFYKNLRVMSSGIHSKT
jgi:hypothetical protein